MKLNVTKGVAKVSIHGVEHTSVKIKDVEIFQKGIMMSDTSDHNATLIADSFNTYNECEILPSELLKQRNELLDALKMMLWAEENGEAESQRQGKPRLATRWEICRNLINNANK